MRSVEVSRGISVTMVSKSAISRSAQPKTESNANMIRFFDEKRPSLPASDIPDGFRELWRFFPEIVIISKSAAKNDGVLKRAEPNRSVTDLTNTRNGCSPIDAVNAWLINVNAPDTFEFGEIQGCFSTMEIHRNGRPVTLTSKEFKTLVYMIKNPRRVISRDELLNEVWGYENYPSTRTVDNHILKLRKKLEAEPAHPKHFHTVYCAGYRFLP
jgi:hypothetical protein